MAGEPAGVRGEGQRTPLVINQYETNAQRQSINVGNGNKLQPVEAQQTTAATSPDAGPPSLNAAAPLPQGVQAQAGGEEDEEDDANETCGFCRFMKGGGCRVAFIVSAASSLEPAWHMLIFLLPWAAGMEQVCGSRAGCGH
jgi:hypothetical protein